MATERSAQRWIVTIAVVAIAVVVVGGALLWLSSVVSTARSPEYKCAQIMQDLEKQHIADGRGPIDPGIYDTTYADCVQRYHNGQN